MNAKLLIQLDSFKSIKDSEGKDINVCFSLSVPYGVPYDLAFSALDDLKQQLVDMQKLNDENKKQIEATEVDSINPEIV